MILLENFRSVRFLVETVFGVNSGNLFFLNGNFCWSVLIIGREMRKNKVFG